MDKARQYEFEQGLQALNRMIDFLGLDGTKVELANATIIGKKYIAVNGDNKKEIDVTSGNTFITHFVKGNYVSRDIIYHEGNSIQHKVKIMSAKLERLSNNDSMFGAILKYIKNSMKKRQY